MWLLFSNGVYTSARNLQIVRLQMSGRMCVPGRSQRGPVKLKTILGDASCTRRGTTTGNVMMPDALHQVFQKYGKFLDKVGDWPQTLPIILL